MTDDRCLYAGSDQPRVLPDRHLEDCDRDMCKGCEPCTRAHCRVCAMSHADGTCPGCLADIRTDLADIVRMCADLPVEVEHRGVDSEAMVLLGPATDPEAWGHHVASAAVGRIPNLETDATRHPLFVLATWEDAVREAYDAETTERATITGAARYLDDQLTTIGADDDLPIEDIARDLRQCCSHLERVLHDGEQVDASRVTCIRETCKARPRLVRAYGSSIYADRWKCPACGSKYDEGDYLEAHAQQLRHAGANKYLPLREAVSTLITQGRSERTIRKWLAGGVGSAYCEWGTHKVLVWWPDLWQTHLGTPVRKRTAA